MPDEIPLTKICTKCGVEKPLEEFSKNSTSKFGRRPECKECFRNRPVDYVFVELKICANCKEEKERICFTTCKSNKDGLQSWCKDCRKEYQKNPEYIENLTQYKREVRASWTEEQWEENRRKDREHYAEHREEIVSRKSHQNSERRKTDPSFKIRALLRERLRGALKRWNIERTCSAIDDLGCSVEELSIYLEEKFLPRMTWENWGRGEGKWNIDHIKPLASFDLSKREQQLEACRYTNLQPLWWRDNLIKGGSLERAEKWLREQKEETLRARASW